MLGDRNAMLATVYPEVGQTLIAQVLAGQQQPCQTSEPAPTRQIVNLSAGDRLCRRIYSLRGVNLGLQSEACISYGFTGFPNKNLCQFA